MADESTNKTISSTDSGFPGYLNFDTLRSEAIAYLGNLSGKIWTDYNVHDPGITILEALIYAVLDLGYRTNLPAADLFTKNPADKSDDNNFFTPSQIFSNNPLTIIDFRKLLIDIKGVKNAWLETEDKLPTDFCKNNAIPVEFTSSGNYKTINGDYLNGLYHVFIELEDDYDTTKPKGADEFDDIIRNIKLALMAHRNLCEDFIDIKILCKLKIGVCADIELDNAAIGEDVYLKVLEALQKFFSPAPTFYTLPQLLEKGKPIEDIFAGRPYNVKESYGFVDTDELAQIQLRKKIHLSDLYQVLFDIEGVKNIRNLAWKLCNNNDPQPDINNKWEMVLPENFIPEFEVTCSNFQFFRYGMKIKLDSSKANSILAMKYSSNGKIPYKQSSGYLDSVIPPGVYRNDLADYYSIQNEFPHVYGIKKGDLSAKASDERKAQVLQLQGFLLFFDQLLANYLSQLKNIRSLFAMSSSQNDEENHTYFTNSLSDVPQLEKLLRFNSGTNSSESLGSDGSTLAFPTGRKNLEDLIASGKIKQTDLDRRCNDVNKDDFPPYQFCYKASLEQAKNQLRDDLLNGDFEPEIVANYNDCFFFYCVTSSPDFVLISKKYYSSHQEAQTAAASIKYLATFVENYRTFLIEDNNAGLQYFSFDLELNLNSYSQFLKLMSEDPALYNSRRQGFLNHLLSRFAEQFTDYALLTSGFVSQDKLQKGQIKAEEKFLTNYPDLSSNRGKGYDYKCDGWNNKNISGFEKRVKALSGIENWQKHNLCNFVVEKADEIYKLSISLFGSSFTVENKMITKEAGNASLNSLYKTLRENPVLQLEFISHEQKWNVFIRDGFGNKYTNQTLFDTREIAEKYINSLHSVLSVKPDPNQNVYVSKFIFKALFKNYKDDLIEKSKEKFSLKEDALEYFTEIAPKISKFLNDSKKFIKAKPELNLEKLILVKKENNSAVYIDQNKFKFRPTDVIQNGITKKRFTFLNEDLNIQFDSSITYDTVRIARRGFEELLRLLTSIEHYSIQKENGNNAFKIEIKNAGIDTAVCFQTFLTKEEAENKILEISNEIISHTYQLSISEPVPDKWEFEYDLINPSGENIQFKTRANYTSEQQAQAAAKTFYSHLSTLKIKNVKKNLHLFLDHKKKIIAQSSLSSDLPGEETPSQLLIHHQDLNKMIHSPTKESINKTLEAGKDSDEQQYIYKLVDKDNLVAKASSATRTMQEALTHRNVLINSFLAGYDFTTLSFGSDIINERKESETNASWYHYRVKCHNVLYQNGNMRGKPLILFESVKGYTSREEAKQAFWDNYLLILRKAFLEINYGENQFISLSEILIHETDNCAKESSTVFVTPETLYEYKGDKTETKKAIILLAKSYPVLYLSEGRYRFRLFNKNTETYEWRSTASYETPQKAHHQFQFFLTLLKYSGNFYIEKNKRDYRYRIYIREVLALSTSSYPTPAEAWGIEGVEKFICTAQTEKGFHNYFNRQDCSHSFYVSCGNTGLIHPCKYETPERRDKVLEELFKAASSFNFFDLLEIDENKDVLLLGLDKNPIAKLYTPVEDSNQFHKCEKLAEIFEAIYLDENYEQSEDTFFLGDEYKETLAVPISADISLADWKKQLRDIACYFPLLKQVNNTPGSINKDEEYNFYIQIKLPGFNNCKDDLADNFPDINSDDECKPACHIAWKSDCCFNSSCEALLFYESTLKLTSNFSNYKPVYECDGGYYGIGLHTEEKIKKEVPVVAGFLDNYIDSNSSFLHATKCLSEIVAFNPQQYNNASIACEAAERAKKLVNSEGLHLVEHILLRPRCMEDANCNNLPITCDKESDLNPENNICYFSYKSGGGPDLGAPITSINFTPGRDPYSFIATLALPAWPQRFRSKESRTVVENLLQKEAPAHVLLRILWLGPRDLSCFEAHFKNWNYWLAKKMGDPEYSQCDFLGFLFHKNFEELHESHECELYDCLEMGTDSCFTDEEEICPDFDLTTQLNNLYCWNKNDYDHYDCENEDEMQELSSTTLLTARAAKVNNMASSSNANSQVDTATDAKDRSVSTGLPPMDEREKSLILQARSSKYKENIKKIADAKPGNKTAENALRFLSDTNPDPERYEDLVNKILKDKPDRTKKVKGLTLKEKNVLIDNISWQYFDRLSVNEKDAGKITRHEALFNHLRKNKIDLKLLYANWNATELKRVEPGINLNEIKKTIV